MANRVLSGMQPSGDVHLGNYLGALRVWVLDQYESDAFYCVVDLHALTSEHDPAALSRRTLDLATWMIAVGVDPSISTLFVQSHVHEHAELTWVLGAVATYGELSRMTQFKDKGKNQETVRADLFTYPVLMAADILLYRADRVPVGDDQRQHLELARNIATRFNNRYGETFVVPEAAIPKVAGRVMDLQEPTRKMSKSEVSPQGTILLIDPAEVVERKIKRAVTDTESEVRFDRENKPGVSNLLDLLAAATGGDPVELAAKYQNYGSLKKDTAEALVEMIRPMQRRKLELDADPAGVAGILAAGAEKASEVAGPTYRQAAAAVGLIPK
ncbi:MAG: tryptophan--tRNA ligase [Acidimicrobiales bacterium]